MAEGAITRILYGDSQVIVGGASSNVQGTDGDDIIWTGIGSSVSGGAGNDIITAGPLSTISGGDGDDQISTQGGSTVDGGAGNDTINTASYSTVTGGDGDDRISAGGRSVVYGGAGADIISIDNGEAHGGDGADTFMTSQRGNRIEGGAGDDTIHLFGDTVLNYSAGDGSDTIRIFYGNSTLQLGEGFTAENTKISIEGNKAVISFDGDESDQLTVNLYDAFSRGSLTVAFSDGSTQELNFDPAASMMGKYSNNYAGLMSKAYFEH
jgi:Ca2+-binding RTX toxin-like protein